MTQSTITFVTKRATFLVVILIVRLIFNAVVISSYGLGQEVNIKGNVVTVTQTTTGCISKVGIFSIKQDKWCSLNEGDEIKITGRLRAGLIDKLLGRLWVMEPVIITSPPTPLLVKARGEDLLTMLRNRLVEIGQRALPEPESGLVLGVVLGLKSNLDRNFYNQLVNSGTIHIVVASGFNVMIVGNIVLAMALVFMRRRMAAVVVIAAMIFYGALAGNDPPIVRAIIMGAVGFVGMAIGRQAQVVWVLFLALLLMLIVEPTLIESVSFQLSAASALGIFWLKPRLEKKITILSTTELTSTLSAMALTAPIIWWHFGRLSLIGIVSNVLIVPLVPLLMMWGGLMLLWGLVLPLNVLVLPVYGLAHLIIVLIGLFGG